MLYTPALQVAFLWSQLPTHKALQQFIQISQLYQRLAEIHLQSSSQLRRNLYDSYFGGIYWLHLQHGNNFSPKRLYLFTRLFAEISAYTACVCLRTLVTLRLVVHRDTEWHSESKARLSKVCVSATVPLCLSVTCLTTQGVYR
jgi:hypothetical protein